MDSKKLVGIIICLQIDIDLLFVGIIGYIIINFIELIEDTIATIGKDSLLDIIKKGKQSILSIESDIESERDIMKVSGERLRISYGNFIYQTILLFGSRIPE